MCWIPCLWFGMYKQRVYIYPMSLPNNKYHIYSQQHFISGAREFRTLQVMGPAPSPALPSFTIVSRSLLPYTLVPLSTLRRYFESILRLCAPSVPLCTICVSVRHLCLCAPSASLCAICAFVRHLRLCAPSVIRFCVSFRHCLCCCRTRRRLCRHCTLPLPPLHTASAAAARHRRFLRHLCSFLFLSLSQPLWPQRWGGCCHTMACISVSHMPSKCSASPKAARSCRRSHDQSTCQRN